MTFKTLPLRQKNGTYKYDVQDMADKELRSLHY